MARPDVLAPFAPPTADIDPQQEQALRDLAAQIPQGLRVELATCFPADAVKANKTRLSYLEHAASTLRACLREDETIRYLCLAREQVWWAMLGAGHWATLLDKNLLVVTDRRVLIIHSDGKGRPVLFANQIPLRSIKKVKGFLASCTLALGRGSRSFQMTYADRKKLKLLFPEKNAAATGGAEYLCPACFTTSERHVERCPACSLAMKSPRIAGWRSLLFPGWGSLYSGHRGFATLQLIRGVVMWLIGIGMLVAAIGNGQLEQEAPFFVALFIALVVFTHGTDALLSRALTKKGLIAHDKKLPANQSWSS